MDLKLRWAGVQIALSVGDVLTTPWHDLTLEANPLIRNFGALPMLALKAVSIWWFARLWDWVDNSRFRALLAIAAMAPMVIAIAWNIRG